jgi:hypothetical protein
VASTSDYSLLTAASNNITARRAGLVVSLPGEWIIATDSPGCHACAENAFMPG